MSRLNTLATSALLASSVAQAGVPATSPQRYDLTGGQAVTVKVLGYLEPGKEAKDLDGVGTGMKTADLVVERTEDPILQMSLEDLIAGDNQLVSRDPRGKIRIQIGCIQGLAVINEDPSFTIENHAALLASSESKPVEVELQFDAHLAGWGGACISLPDGLKVHD